MDALIVPTVEDNAAIWDGSYDWSGGGEEWSAAWGGSEAPWHGTIFPRIARFLPTGTTLELAPGYGRWTEYLRRHCERLVLVDLSEKCIRACRERFGGDSRVEYHVNDGSSLDMVETGSIDFVFSFDSLVHAEAPVLAAYARGLARVLARDGAGFVHHSNAREYRLYFEARRHLPRGVLRRLVDARVLDRLHRRALSASAEDFRSFCREAGLQCSSQELVNWGGRGLIDCLSTFAPASSRWARPTRVRRNRGFMAEADAVRRQALLGSSG